MATRDIDHTAGGWLWADRALLDQYGPVVGPYGIAVYVALARYAGAKSQACWPSVGTLAEATGMSVRQVQNSLRVLETEGLVEVQQQIGAASVYTLCQVVPAEGCIPCRGGVHVVQGGGACGAPKVKTVNTVIQREGETESVSPAPVGECASEEAVQEKIATPEDFGFVSTTAARPAPGRTVEQTRANVARAVVGYNERAAGIRPATAGMETEDESPISMRKSTDRWLEERFGPAFCQWSGVPQPASVIRNWRKAARDIVGAAYAQLKGQQQGATWSDAYALLEEAVRALFTDRDVHPKPWAFKDGRVPTYADLWAAKADLLYITAKLAASYGRQATAGPVYRIAYDGAESQSVDFIRELAEAPGGLATAIAYGDDCANKVRAYQREHGLGIFAMERGK